MNQDDAYANGGGQKQVDGNTRISNIRFRDTSANQWFIESHAGMPIGLHYLLLWD